MVRLSVAAAVALTSAACASATAVPRPFPGGPVVEMPSAPPSSDGPLASPGAEVPPDSPYALTARRYDGRAVAGYALAFQGVRYRLGGADPAGFDCSGLVQYVFGQYGVALPRVVEQQWHVGDRIKPRNIRAGDLIFFSTTGSGASHVGIALGGERFVHAPNSTGVVRVESLTSDYWREHYIGARRITPPAATN